MASQYGAHAEDIELCRVIIRLTLPTTGPVEIIYPVKEARHLAEMTNSQCMIEQTVETIFATLLSLISITPLSLRHKIPNQRILWQGSQTELSSLDTKPALSKSSLTVLLREAHSSRELAIP